MKFNNYAALLSITCRMTGTAAIRNYLTLTLIFNINVRVQGGPNKYAF